MNVSGSCIFCASDPPSLGGWREAAVLSMLCHPLVIVDHRHLSDRWTLVKVNRRRLIKVHLHFFCFVNELRLILCWLSCCQFRQWYCPPLYTCIHLYTQCIHLCTLYTWIYCTLYTCVRCTDIYTYYMYNMYQMSVIDFSSFGWLSF